MKKPFSLASWYGQLGILGKTRVVQTIERMLVGDQSRLFLLVPQERVFVGQNIVGAERVYRILKAKLLYLQGDQLA